MATTNRNGPCGPDDRLCIQCGKWFERRTLYRHLQEGCCQRVPTEPTPDQTTIGEQLFHNFIGNLEDNDRSCFDIPPSSENAQVDSDDESDDDSDLDLDLDDLDPEFECDWVSDMETEDTSDNNKQKLINIDLVIRHICQYMLIWQSRYKSVSDAAVDSMLNFLSVLFSALGVFCATCKYIASKLPSGLSDLRTKSGTLSAYQKYVVCPKCKTLYENEQCHMRIEGKLTPKACTFIAYPNSAKREICGQVLGKVSGTEGKEKFVGLKHYFYQPLHNILTRFLMRAGFEEKCEQWRTRHTKEGVKTDIYDGDMWKDFSNPTKYHFFNFPRHYGVMINVDWFQPWKDVKYSVGAIYLVLLNLPIEERYKLENVILVGLMPDFDHEPATNTFLKPLVDELLQAWNYGFHLVTHSSPLVPKIFKVAMICRGCDIPAARKVCGFLSHAAVLGCNKCLRSFKGRDYTGFDVESWDQRTNEDHRRRVKIVNRATSDVDKAAREKHYGVRYSVLLELPYFDPIRMCVIDPMHNLLLGTPKRFLKVLRDRKVLKRRHFKILQEKVNEFKCPADIGGIPHKIESKFSKLTADQWKNWTILFSMFALRFIFDKNSEVLKCWQKYALACRCLCTRVMDESTLIRGHGLLIEFAKSFERLCGKTALSPNIHLHCHLRDCISDYGPIYSFWLFSFERYNGILGSYQTNNHDIESQLFVRFTSDVNIRGLQEETYMKEFDSLRNKLLAGSRRRGALLEHSKPFTSLQMVNLSSPSCAILNYEWDLPWYFRETVTGQKECMLDEQELSYLGAMYMYLYGPIALCTSDFVIYPTCHETNTLCFMGQVLGGSTGRNKRSSVIGAHWCDNMGHIVDTDKERPGQVYRYLLHKVDICGQSKLHVVAQVHWFNDANPRSIASLGNLKPVEVWSNGKVNPGPAMFVPIQRLKYKAVSTAGLWEGRNLRFVCPRQRYLVYD